MARHSKWANIKRGKALTDARRSNVFTKLGRLITVAARLGGEDPSTNFRLRLAIQAARDVSMPKENIDRAVKRGAGMGGEAQLEELTYEAYGPGGVALLIEATTDNRNRAVNEIKKVLNDNGGTLGASGSTAYLFRRVGLVSLENALDEAEQLMAMDAGAEDLEIDEHGTMMEIPVEKFGTATSLAQEKKWNVREAKLSYVAQTTVSAGDGAALMACVEALEELDDVQNVYHNAEIA